MALVGVVLAYFGEAPYTYLTSEYLDRMQIAEELEAFIEFERDSRISRVDVIDGTGYPRYHVCSPPPEGQYFYTVWINGVAVLDEDGKMWRRPKETWADTKWIKPIHCTEGFTGDNGFELKPGDHLAVHWHWKQPTVSDPNNVYTTVNEYRVRQSDLEF